MTDDNKIEPKLFTTFEVDSGGTLRVAGFVNATQRKDFYPHIADWWDENTESLKQAMNECLPLRWALEKIYWDQHGETAPDPAEDPIHLHTWLNALPSEMLQEQILPVLRDWFEQPPKWSFEDDYFDTSTTTGQGAALSFFNGMEPEELYLLGVEIIEGDRPGSSYMAAELTGDIDEANAAAVENGLPVRFIKANT